MIDRTEEQIMKEWNNNEIVVSICCITYNHILYIQQCIDSFLIQKTNFAFEIIIHDDASTDGTVDVLQEYEKKYPNIITILYEDENQYSKGVRGIYVKYVFPRAKGKYIALCEGDDYWIDENKLQRQVGFLESNDKYTLIAENTMVYNSIKNSEYLFSSEIACEYNLSDILIKRRFTTSSVMFRFLTIKSFLSLLKISCDTIIFACCASLGKISYQPIISSVYRRGMQGVTENTNKLEWARLNESWVKQIYELFYPEILKHKILDYNLFKSYCVSLIYAIKTKKISEIFHSIVKIFSYFKIKYIIFLIKEKLC